MIKKTDKIFVDTNILIFLFSPLVQNKHPHKIAKYSKVLQFILENKNEVFISSLVVSEYINRYLRWDFQIKQEAAKGYLQYKRDYRNTAECHKSFKVAMQELYKFYSLTQAKHIEDGFDKISFDYFSSRSDMDFNDTIIAEIVRKNGLRLLTDDSDFRKMEVDIIHF